MDEKAARGGNLGCKYGISHVTNRRSADAHAADANLGSGEKPRVIEGLARIAQITARVLRRASGYVEHQEYIDPGGSPGVSRNLTVDEDQILLLGNPAAIFRGKNLHAGFGVQRRVGDYPYEENKR
jgi:hypothetical protein